MPLSFSNSTHPRSLETSSNMEAAQAQAQAQAQALAQQQQQPQPTSTTTTTAAPRSSGRRRRGAAAGNTTHTCPHCGRSFKRSEHKERHVRTHTKEKPFICHCGAAFTRRDLLTRHQRIALHERTPPEERAAAHAAAKSPGNAVDDMAAAAAAAAASLSGMSMTPWGQQQPQPPMPMAGGYRDPNPGLDEPPGIVAQPFQQPMLAHEYFDNGQDIGGGFDHFREFANFLDGVGLPAEWSPYFHGPEPENDLLDPELRDPRPDATDMATHDGRAGTPFSYWLPSAPEKSKLTEGQPENSIHVQ